MVAICDTFNECSDIDLIIPANNNGKKSLALIFWILAREVSRKRKKKFSSRVKEFGYEEKPEKPEPKEEDRFGRGFRSERRDKGFRTDRGPRQRRRY